MRRVGLLRFCCHTSSQIDHTITRSTRLLQKGMLCLHVEMGLSMSTLEAKIAKLGSNHLAAAVERYAADLSQSVGERQAAELMVAAAFAMLYRTQGGERTRLFARRCYWSAIEAFD